MKLNQAATKRTCREYDISTGMEPDVMAHIYDSLNGNSFVTLCYTGRLFQGLNSHIGITVVCYMELPVLNFPSFASCTPA